MGHELTPADFALLKDSKALRLYFKREDATAILSVGVLTGIPKFKKGLWSVQLTYDLVHDTFSLEFLSAYILREVRRSTPCKFSKRAVKRMDFQLMQQLKEIRKPCQQV